MNTTHHAPASPLAALRGVDDFPVLGEGSNAGGPLTYLDSAASSQKPLAVLDAMRDTYLHAYANVHRGVYHLAAEATSRFEGAREAIRSFIGAASAREVIFTRGTTEAINLVAYSWGMANVGPGDVIVCSELEHHSNLVPWQQLALRTGAQIRYMPVDDHGVMDINALDAFAREGTIKLVAFAHVSNTLGSVAPVRAIVERAHALGALVLVDGAQAAPHRVVDVTALGCDFYAFSGHKMCGPSGIGILWGREQVLADMPPFQFGGEMISRVAYESTTFNSLPWKFEAGTPAIVEAVGLGAAVSYLDAVGMERIAEHDHALTDHAVQAMLEVPGLALHGPPPGADRGGILSFTLDCAHPHDIATLLDARDVCVRAGNHCTQPLLRKMGLHATARASTYLYNGAEDIDRLVAALHEVRRIFTGS